MTRARCHRLLLIATVFLSFVAGQACSLSPNADLPSAGSGDSDDFGDGDFSPGDGDVSLGDGDVESGGMGGADCKSSEPTPGGMGGAAKTSCR